MLSTKEAIDLVKQTEEYIDIIEIGTPLIKHEGIELIKKMKKFFPKKILLVDLKTMDVGEYESDFCFEAGADIVTVLGVADIDTIKGSIKSAKKHKRKLLVDLINVENKLARAKEISNEGDVYLGIHTGIDQQNRGESPLKHLKELSVLNRPLFVAGGINLDNIDEIIAQNPYTIIVGGAISSSQNPNLVAKIIKSKIDGGNQS
jgi:3-hexulose-6-phosphate synthase